MYDPEANTFSRTSGQLTAEISFLGLCWFVWSPSLEYCPCKGPRDCLQSGLCEVVYGEDISTKEERFIYAEVLSPTRLGG